MRGTAFEQTLRQPLFEVLFVCEWKKAEELSVRSISKK
jgi:hypothetical protein